MRIQLLHQHLGHAPGAEIDVARGPALELIRRGVAKAIDPAEVAAKPFRAPAAKPLRKVRTK